MTATKRKQSTPIGTVSAMPWAGVPVTTARRAAALLRAKLAAERTARVTPSTRGGSLRSCSTRKNNPMLVSWLAAPPRPRSAPRAFLPLLLGWLASAIVHRSRILSQHHRARVCSPIAGAALALQRFSPDGAVEGRPRNAQGRRSPGARRLCPPASADSDPCFEPRTSNARSGGILL